jgi:aldose 1-epimerase
MIINSSYKRTGALSYQFVINCFVFCLISYASAIAAAPNKTNAGIVKQDWGEVGGKKVYLYTLTNKNGTEIKITNYGASITSWITKDKAGNRSNIVVGFDSLEQYVKRAPNYGASIGRFANRIANAQFVLDGKTYNLSANDTKNHMHGGFKGFGKVVWDADAIVDKVPSLVVRYFSKDGEEGYPGNLKVSVKFTVTNADELVIEYNAQTDKATPINFTNHPYFNLTGDIKNTILSHTLWIDANNYIAVDSTLIPTGEIKPVKGTAFDFTTPHKIGDNIALTKLGYDNSFVLNKKDKAFKKVATLFDNISGRRMDVFTTEPGLQFYTGNFLNGTLKNRDGKFIEKRTALCLETQHFPDSPNKPNFPSTILRAGENYHSVTKYKISIK